MFFRTSFLIAIFAIVFTIISQSSSVYASPAPGLRPFLHAFDVETSGIASSDSIAPTASASATAVEVIDAAASSSSPEASPTPDSSSDTPQANSAFSGSPGFSAAMLISAVAVVVQLI